MSIKEMWKYLIFQTKGYRIIEIVIVLGSVCGAAIAYINSFLYAKILDQLLERNFEQAIRITVIMILAVFLTQTAAKACDQIFEHYILPSSDETKKRTARKAFIMEYEELEKQENLSAFRRVRAGELGAGGIDEQLSHIYHFFMECVKVIFSFLFLILLICSSVSGGTRIGETILLTVILTALFGITFRINYRISDALGKRRVALNLMNEKSNSMGAYLGSIMNSEQYAKDIRLYGMQGYLLKKFSHVTECGKSFTEYGVYEGKSNGKFSFAIQILAGYIYVYVALNALNGSVTVGDVLMYAGAIITMMTSVQEILSTYGLINYRNEYLKTYEEFIKRPNMHYDGTLPIEKRDDNRYELSFSHVSFQYPGTSQYVLRDVSLKFCIGEKMALVGLNGAGKTTIIKLLLRLYEPTEGKICLNGIDIGKYDYEEYLQIFSVVFQDFKLFDFPLDENIASGEKADAELVKKVIDQVGLSELVERMPEKEHTLLYHETGQGVVLSGGEAQKAAIARAIYKNAPFVILDEPTAALDPVAEAEIYENFDSLIGDKTAVYISHRMSSCKFCDRIVVVDGGSVVEEGTHEELVKAGGVYAKLYQTQAAYYK